MELERSLFEALAYIEENGEGPYSPTEISGAAGISTEAAEEALEAAVRQGLAEVSEAGLRLSEKGLAVLEPYRVKRAVFFVAGFGSRMAPVTLDTPKPLVMVNGVRIIDRMLDAMTARGITDITLVRGYLKEKFDVLKEKYPFIRFIDNERFSEENNISSALAAGERVDNCYICAGDLLLNNPGLIKKYHYRSNYLASYAQETDDWCFDNVGGFAENYRKGGHGCFNQYEITYWNSEDSARLREDWKRAYNTEGGRDLFWEFIPLVLYKDDYRVEIRPCNKEDIVEIDSFEELVCIDKSYIDYESRGYCQ